MAEETIALDLLVKADGSVKTVSDLKQEIKDLQNEALKAKVAGDEMLSNKFLDQAGKAKDVLNDIREEVAALDPGSKAQAFVNLGQSIAGGFAAATAASQMFGLSNESVEKQLLKVQQATALLQGVQALADAKRSIEIVKQIALVNLQTGAESKNIIVRYAAIAAQKALNLVMSANPVMLVVTAVIALIGAYKMLGGEATKSAEEIEEANKRKLESERQMLEKSRAFHEENRKLLQRVQDARVAIIEDSQEKEIAAIRLRFDREYDEINKRLESEPLRWKTLTALRVAKEEEEQQALAAIREKYRSENEQKVTEYATRERERKAKEGEERIKTTELEEANRKAQEQIILDAEAEKQAKEDELKAFRAEQKMLDDEALLESMKLDIENNANASIEMKLAVLAREHGLLMQNEKLSYEQRQFLEKKFLSDRRRLIIGEEEKIRAARFSIADSSVKGLLALNDIFVKDGKKHAKFQKALALTQIAIDTAKAISSLTAASQANPTNAATFGASGVAQFIAGIAQILSNVAQAKQILTEGDSHGVAGGGGGSMPSINMPPVSPINELPEFAEEKKGEQKKGTNTTLINDDGSTSSGSDMRVYVVESDIRDANKRVQMLEQRATF